MRSSFIGHYHLKVKYSFAKFLMCVLVCVVSLWRNKTICLVPVTRPYLFNVPTLNLFHLVNKMVRNFNTKKVGTKIYIWLSTAFICIKPLHLAAMLHCACCLQYIISIVLNTRQTLSTQTIHWKNVIISPLTQHQETKSLPTLPFFLGGGAQESDIFCYLP